LNWDGNTWSRFSTPTYENLFSVEMVTAADGWAVGSNGIILRYVGANSISGQVTDGSSNPISGVSVSDGAGDITTTDSNGNYTLSGETDGTYNITPSKNGFTFLPASRSMTVPPDATGQDFTGNLVNGAKPWLIIAYEDF
jgi:hypothetical protein